MTLIFLAWGHRTKSRVAGGDAAPCPGQVECCRCFKVLRYIAE